MLKWVWLSIVIGFIDQLTKWMVNANFELYEVLPVMPHLNLTLTYNTGAAFGFLSSQGGWQQIFFAVLAIGVSAYIVYWLNQLTDDQLWTSIGLALVLGGAMGNLIDRVLQAKVTDFIDFFVDWDVFFLSNGHFATFNIADIAIAVGAAILVFISLFSKEEINGKLAK
ncbi:MAG: lipoprotein signal peptidase [Cocleimonas sp.]|nr:lipoprotein signal peptidase [Cocleimonas sp.]